MATDKSLSIRQAKAAESLADTIRRIEVKLDEIKAQLTRLEAAQDLPKLNKKG